MALGALAFLLIVVWIITDLPGLAMCCGSTSLLVLAAVPVLIEVSQDEQTKLRHRHLAFAEHDIPELAITIRSIEKEVARRESGARTLLQELRRHRRARGEWLSGTDEDAYKAALQGGSRSGDPQLDRWISGIRTLKAELDSLYGHAEEAYLAHRKMQLSPIDTDAYKVHVQAAKDAAARSKAVYEEVQEQLERGDVLSSDS